MIAKKEMVAMLLAGGAGNRLYVLTKERAKPAVPFGGKYKIIDFPISNCVNSGVDTVGVLTQYQPLELNTYIGNGQPWDLDRMYGGVHILPPYLAGATGEWYKGTANAIYQNLHFMDQFDPEYVLILSGDHIYKMDYAKMLQFHKEKNADLTIAVLNVTMEEATRFGILNTNPDLSVYEFEEKPAKPKSTNASMGIYIFNYKKLKEYLIKDEENPASSNDFGKDVIPAMLNDKCKLFAFPFEGYWKDVGTIDSLWEANMDLLNPKLPLNLSDPLWRIYSRHNATTPHYIDEKATVADSIISSACEIYGNVSQSVIFANTTVGEGTNLEYSVIMPNVKIGKNAKIQYAIIADDAVIEDGAIIGADPRDCKEGEWGIAVIGQGAVIKSGQVVLPKQIV
ncbi:MAG: glucose-1-phosphate adenylyltransferase [Clostridia bacterium]|nr:glucose-1-phosphate adenylyltransferase [Clostridia bacterium]